MDVKTVPAEQLAYQTRQARAGPVIRCERAEMKTAIFPSTNEAAADKVFPF
jgi:hypothetical protein